MKIYWDRNYYRCGNGDFQYVASYSKFDYSIYIYSEYPLMYKTTEISSYIKSLYISKRLIETYVTGILL